MKNLIFVVMFFAASCGLAVSAEPANQSCMTSEGKPQTRMQSMPDGTVAQQVMCCCQNVMGQMCCNYQTACLGLVKGCICQMNSPESEPANAAATTIKS